MSIFSRFIKSQSQAAKCRCSELKWLPTNYDELTKRQTISLAIINNSKLIKGDCWYWLAECNDCKTYWICHRLGRCGEFVSAYHTDNIQLPEYAEDLVSKIVELNKQEQQKEHDINWFKQLGPEIGPEKCKNPDCNKLRIKQSVFCVSHHFEMIKGVLPPYDYSS
jgi:hypothetical protein